MPPRTARRPVLALLAGLPWWARPSAAALDWPSRPMRLVLSYPSGGAPDLFVREIAAAMSQSLGVAVLVDNRPGASGLLGVRAISQSAPDPHTFAYVSSGHVTLAAMNPKFDLLRELKPVCRLTASPLVAVVHADSPHATMAALIAAAQARPGTLAYGSAGPGSPSHMAVAFLQASRRNFQALHVPYKGAVEAINAILGRQIDFTIGVLGAAMPHIVAGTLRPLGVTSPKRVPMLPDVPTIAEAGVGGYAYQAWGGFMAHVETPDAVVARADAAFRSAMRTEGVAGVLARTGALADVSVSPSAFGAQLRIDLGAEQAVVKRLGIVQE
jgi:tripartite-type tricarboxylate transporter receptor subunit TctC